MQKKIAEAKSEEIESTEEDVVEEDEEEKLRSLIEAFARDCGSMDDTHEFSPTLNAHQRKLVHQIAEEFQVSVNPIQLSLLLSHPSYQHNL